MNAIQIPSIIPIRKLAELTNVSPAKILAALFNYGVKATINESIDCDTAAIIGDELGIKIEKEKTLKEETDQTAKPEADDLSNFASRPPVVTIMGHVDHGKTAILDKIRETHIADKEAGGITQHIGAYQVTIRPLAELSSRGSKATRGIPRAITFLDTPGHEAFSAMRSHGANITDIVVLVVAADDGVKPQTIEAVSHAKAAKVPIIVAINKIDKPNIDIEMTKRQLADLGLTPEEWGGETVIVPVSAKTGEGINELLEMIILTSDFLELKANFKGAAEGVVIESKLHPSAGPLATILIQNGILNQGEILVIGGTYGRIRTMEDYQGKRIKKAEPGTPVLISGLKRVPEFGERFRVVDSEKIAKMITESAEKERKVRRLIKRIDPGAMEEISKDENENVKLDIILKADVKGSLEAIKTSLQELGSEEAKVNIILEGIGAINESDVNQASTAKSLVIGFHVPVSPPVRKLAEALKVKIALYNVIYDLVDDIFSLLSSLLQPEKIKITLGSAELLAVFLANKDGGIVGLKVKKGKIEPDSVALVKRENKELGEIKIKTLQINQQKVLSVDKDSECGIGYTGGIRLKKGDALEIYKVEERKRELKKS